MYKNIEEVIKESKAIEEENPDDIIFRPLMHFFDTTIAFRCMIGEYASELKTLDDNGMSYPLSQICVDLQKILDAFDNNYNINSLKEEEHNEDDI